MRISDWSSDVCSSDLEDGDRDVHDLTGIQTRLDVEARGSAAVEQHIVVERGAGRDVADLRNQCGDFFLHPGAEIGRASCRARVCQYGLVPVAAASLKNNTHMLLVVKKT